MMEVEKILESKTAITSPCFDAQGNLYMCSTQTGDLLFMNINDNAVQVFGNTKGVPSGIAVNKNDDESQQQFYICDLAHQAVFMLNTADQQIEEFVREYEGKIFKGPNNLVFDSQGVMYFTDSGPMGETTMQKPHGSVFAVTSVSDGELLQPLALECLAHPSGIALSPSEDAIYVSETLNNRILRFVQKPAGVYHCSEFYKFSGRFGPTALAIDGDGNIYAAHFDFKEYNADTEGRGQIAVISPQGELVKRIFVPGPEITGLAFDSQKEYLYITEASSKSLFRARVVQ